MPIIDSVKKMAVETGLALDDCLELYQDFFNDYDPAKRELLISIKHNDFNAIYKQAHKLSGLFANLQMSNLSDIASMIESSAKYGIECVNLISFLFENCDEMREEFSGLMNSAREC